MDTINNTETVKASWIDTYIDPGTGCAVIILGGMLIIGFILLIINAKKCSKRYESIRGIFTNGLLTDSNEKYELVMFHIKRCETYYNAFFMWQLISKGINILCLTCTFLSIAPGKNEDTAKVISVLGFLCIVSQIYLNPSKRAEQYLNAWRNAEYHLLKILSGTDPDDNGTDPNDPGPVPNKSNAKTGIMNAFKNIDLNQCKDLNSDEREMMITRINQIPKVFKKVENSISSDAE